MHPAPQDDGARRQESSCEKARGGSPERLLERFPAKWKPVRVKKTRQIKNLVSVPMQSERKWTIDNRGDGTCMSRVRDAERPDALDGVCHQFSRAGPDLGLRRAQLS